MFFVSGFLSCYSFGKEQQALEVCVDDVESAINAWRGGAERLELCSSLSLGGLTPSAGLFRTVKKKVPPELPIFVMIRADSREDFTCGVLELEVMMEDVAFFKENGAEGFVFGCLKDDASVDEDACAKLLEAAGNRPCTFHRAFDVAKDPSKSLQTISRLGFSRILTSGQQANAWIGRGLIKSLVSTTKETNLPLVVVAGGGIDPHNLAEILDATGVEEFHGSARDKSTDVKLTSESVVRAMVAISRRYRTRPGVAL